MCDGIRIKEGMLRRQSVSLAPGGAFATLAPDPALELPVNRSVGYLLEDPQPLVRIRNLEKHAVS